MSDKIQDNEILADCAWFADKHRGKNKQSGAHWSTIIRFPKLYDEAVKLQMQNETLQSEIARLTARVQELEGLLDKANACIGSVVACCTYGSEQSAKIGAYGISLDAFTKIDTYMRTISESNWQPLSQPPQEGE